METGDRRGPVWRFARAALAAALVVQLLGCGTILYPERRNQPAGKYDTDVVVLDAIGLFFFILPGVIAFAVDFSTGAIYLPRGGKSRLKERFGGSGIQPLELDAATVDSIALTVQRATGLALNLYSPSVQIVPGREGESVEARLRELNLPLLVTIIPSQP